MTNPERNLQNEIKPTRETLRQRGLTCDGDESKEEQQSSTPSLLSLPISAQKWSFYALLPHRTRTGVGRREKREERERRGEGV